MISCKLVDYCYLKLWLVLTQFEWLTVSPLYYTVIPRFTVQLGDRKQTRYIGENSNLGMVVQGTTAD